MSTESTVHPSTSTQKPSPRRPGVFREAVGLDLHPSVFVVDPLRGDVIREVQRTGPDVAHADEAPLAIEGERRGLDRVELQRLDGVDALVQFMQQFEQRKG